MKERKKKSKFEKKLTRIMTIVLIALVSTYSTIFYFVARNSLIKSSSKECHMNAGFALKSVYNSVETDKNLVQVMANSPSIINYCVKPNAKNYKIVFKDLLAFDPYTTGKMCMIASNTDRYVHYTPSNESMYIGDVSAESFDAMAKLPVPYALEVHPYTDGTPYMWIDSPVKVDGEFVGFVCTGAPLDDYCNKVLNALDSDANVMILDNEYNIIATKDPLLAGQRINISQMTDPETESEIRELVKSIKTDEIKTVVSKGSVCCITTIPQIGFVIMSYRTIETGDIFTGKRNTVLYIILAFLLVLFAGIYVTLVKINDIRVKEQNLGLTLAEETQNLVVATKETAATSQDQSAAVKEIVATMEDSNALSENISQKIKDVSGVAQKTTCDVSDGAAALSINVEKLHEIFDANQQTIDGIKLLGEKIENIWDIVTLINSVADQAKIIAFNAELEAASAGEAGKNFHIVATEIRRLADGIIDGTKEIKEKINEIQQSSDSLIIASESGTEKINEGCETAKELEAKFESIRSAAEITANSASDITTIIQQQTVGSGQILITLKQIAAGVENFTAATENISNSAQNLKQISAELHAVTSSIEGNEANQTIEEPKELA